MFNEAQFEQNVYATVNKKVNIAFKAVSNLNGYEKIAKGSQILRQIISILNDVTEETIVQVFHGLTMNKKAEKEGLE